MSYLKKHGFLIILLLLLSCVYFVTRLYHLTSLPLFTDESIYIRWSQIGLHDPAYRFLSLTDGKQPLFIWIMYPFLKVFHDPLVAGRMVSVFSGFATMFGIGAVSYILFRRKMIALLTMLLYVLYPFAQVMDRMALYDSMVAMFFIWSVFVSIIFVRNIRLDVAYTLGFVLGAGILTKTSNYLSIYLLPLTLLLFNFRQKHWGKALLKWVGFAAIAIVITQIMYAILRLSPLPNVISEKNNTFYYPLAEWIQHPFQYVVGNLNGLTVPLFQYLTIPYVFLILIALVYFQKDLKEKLMLLGYFLIPFIGFAFIGKEIFARYVFFMSLPLILLAGWGLGYLTTLVIKRMHAKAEKRFVIGVILSILFAAYPAYVSFAFASNPITAPIAKADKSQYVTAWTGGWGLKDVVSYFDQQAQSGPIYIATEGTFGLYPQGIELYLAQNPNISIKGYYWEILKDIPTILTDQAAKMPTYIVFYQPCPGGICPRPGDAPAGWPVQAVKEFTTAGTETRVVIYQVQPSTETPHETAK